MISIGFGVPGNGNPAVPASQAADAGSLAWREGRKPNPVPREVLPVHGQSTSPRTRRMAKREMRVGSSRTITADVGTSMIGRTSCPPRKPLQRAVKQPADILDHDGTLAASPYT